MSDQPTTSGDHQPSKGAPDPLPKHQTMTFGQHLFIWTMILVVGVLFGLGYNVRDLMNPSRSISGVDQTEILVHQRVAHKLQNALATRRNPYIDDSVFSWMPLAQQFDMGVYECERSETYASLILLGRQAGKEGLMPDGKALDTILQDFLNREDRESGRRYAEILNDLGESKRVTEAELRTFVAERYAVSMLHQTHATTPAVPLAMSEVVGAMRDQIEVDEVVIDAKPLLPEVKANDADIQSTYDKMRNERFRRAAARMVDAVLADQQKVSDAVVISDADIAKYYEAHKEQYLKPEAPKPEAKDGKKDDKKDDKKDPPKPDYKALAEVSGEIREILRREGTEARIKALFEAFEKTMDENIDTIDLATLKDRAAKAGLLVKEGIVVEEPMVKESSRGGAYQIKDVGEVEVTQVNLFNQEMNFVSTVIQARNGGARTVLRIAGKRDAGFRELTDPAVMKEVTALVAGNRAYKDFLKAMEELRATAEKLGPGGLRKALAAEAAIKWDAAKKVTTATKRALTELTAPPSEAGGISGDTRLLASLLLPNRPVAITAEAPADGVPQVRLIQAVALKVEPAMAEAERPRQAEAYRHRLEGYRSALYQMDLNNRITRN